MTLKPVFHGRDHRPGGTDPIPGGGVVAAILQASIGSSLSVPNNNVILPYAVDPVGQTFGEIEIGLLLPRFVYAAGSVVVLSNPTITNIDTTYAFYDMQVDVYAFNDDASEAIHLQGTATASAGGPGDSCTVAHSGLSVISTTGSDLSYSTLTGHISSAAGGNYAAELVAFGAWT